jgi:DNA-binding CsgD family transcriptional regulator
MRSLTVVIQQPVSSQPATRLFQAGSELTRERIRQLTVLDDGTVVLLGRLRGDLDHARQLIDTVPEILGYSLTEVGENDGLVFVHAEPPPPLARFLDLQHEYEVFFDFPIEGTDDNALRVTMVGKTNAALQEALAAVPEELEPTVERIGTYRGTQGDVEAILTERQREVLDTALDLGYYESPRETTQQDIADELDVAVGTVGEHLQKIEARVFGTLVE